MPQSGFTPIQIYSSSTPTNAPSAGNLTNDTKGSELAINIADKNLFFKDSTNAVNTVPIRQSGAASDGWLSSTDWNTFNNKQPAGAYLTSVTADAPLSGAGTSASHLVISQATTSTNGYLSSTDWNTFNGKQTALVSGTNIKTVSGTTLLGSGDLGTIATGYGGTGLTSFTANGVVYASSTSALATGSSLVFDGTNLGVGVSSPTYIIDVSKSTNGDAGPRITNSNAGTAAIANFTANNGTSFSIFGQGGASYGGYAQIRANGAVIYTNGSGGIGFSADNAAGVITFGTGSSAPEVMRLDASGGLILAGSTAQKATGTTWSNPSDIRLKDNVREYEKSLKELMQIRVCEWEYNGKGGTTKGVKGLGVIADEIMLVLPDTVQTYEAKLNVDDDEVADIKKFDATEITWLLVKAVQELNAKITALQS